MARGEFVILGLSILLCCVLAHRDEKEDFKPRILTKPNDSKNVTGENVALSCEAEGRPVPTLSWLLRRVTNETFNLPESDDHMSVSFRGGPEKHQISGWIQIEDIQEHHEGDYICVATNPLGEDRSEGRIVVSPRVIEG